MKVSTISAKAPAARGYSQASGYRTRLRRIQQPDRNRLPAGDHIEDCSRNDAADHLRAGDVRRQFRPESGVPLQAR